MESQSPKPADLRIVLIGAGNVGFHLGKRLYEKGFKLLQVYSRQEARAAELAAAIHSSFTTDLAGIDQTADLYILAVHDDAIPAVAQNLAAFHKINALVVHTSGATPSRVLAPYFSRHGVFYPLQTFSRNRAVDFSVIPCCVDSPDEADRRLLFDLGNACGSRAYAVSDEQRAVLHVAAVFVNNFSNYLYRIGETLLSENELPFELLRPLIAETAAKVSDHSPADMQTGPAVRGDRETIARHLAYLERFPEYREIYRLMSEGIRSMK